MEVYKEMYRELFIAVTKAIEQLQQVQQKCEELYIGAEERERVIPIINPFEKK